MIGWWFTGLALLIASAADTSGFSLVNGPNSLSSLGSLGGHIKQRHFPASSSLSSSKHPPGRGLAAGIGKTAVMENLPEGRKNGKVTLACDWLPSSRVHNTTSRLIEGPAAELQQSYSHTRQFLAHLELYLAQGLRREMTRCSFS